jgi:dGTP triphosphohydrolase
MMNWEQLLSLKRQGDKGKRLRIEQDDTRLGFEVDYDRIIFSSAFRSLQDKTQVIPSFQNRFCSHTIDAQFRSFSCWSFHWTISWKKNH